MPRFFQFGLRALSGRSSGGQGSAGERSHSIRAPLPGTENGRPREGTFAFRAHRGGTGKKTRLSPKPDEEGRRSIPAAVYRTESPCIRYSGQFFRRKALRGCPRRGRCLAAGRTRATAHTERALYQRGVPQKARYAPRGAQAQAEGRDRERVRTPREKIQRGYSMSPFQLSNATKLYTRV